MKEISAILKAYDALKNPPQTAAYGMALAMVVRLEGSSYRRLGARMLVVSDGTWVGGISGGCLEGDALRRAQKAISLQKPSLVRYDTTDDDKHQIGVGLGCEGVIDVLFMPIDVRNPENAVEQLRRFVASREPQILLTTLSAPEQEAENAPRFGSVYSETAFKNQFPKFFKNLAPTVKKVVQRRKSQVCETLQGSAILIEHIQPTLQLIIFGNHADVLPLVRFSRELGWRVQIGCNPAKAPKAFFELADRVEDRHFSFPSDAYTALVFMTHDLKTDVQLLRKLAFTEAPYVGILGPRKRFERLLEDTADTDFSAISGKIFAPIGLDIGATTPEEIALAIVAEIQAHFSGFKAGFLRKKKGTIHTP
jgi:xanthine dehydrogenase accessory factor